MPRIPLYRKLIFAVLIAPTVTFAEPSVTVDSVTLDSDGTGVTSDTYNGEAAVCGGNKAAGLDVDATYTPVFTTPGMTVGAQSGCNATSNCNAVPAGPIRSACLAAGGNKYKTASLAETGVQNESVSASASDTFSNSVSLSGSNIAQSGNMPLASANADNLILTTVSATASEERQNRTGTRYYFYTANNCQPTESSIDDWGGWSGWTQYDSSEATNSASYYLDIQAPTLSHTIDKATVEQCDSVGYNMTASGGSSAQNYSLQPKATGPVTINGPTTNSSFVADFIDGIAPDEVKAASLSIGCATPVGTYTSGATLDTNDLCGDNWGAIGSSSSPSFEVTAAAASCTNQAVVTAPLTGNLESGGVVGYEIAECYNTEPSNGKGKFVAISSSPGTVHVGAIVKTTDACESETGFVTGINIEFDLPDNFHVDCSGKSPAVHVFAGLADSPDLGNPQYENGFYFHSGDPLMEITSLIKAEGGITTVDGSCDKKGKEQKMNFDVTGVTVDMGGIDLGFGTGKIPVGWTVYARAHTRAHAEDSGADAVFEVQAWTDTGSLTTETVDLPETDSCVAGQLP